MVRESYVVEWLLVLAVFPNAISPALPSLLNWYKIDAVYIVHRRRRLVEDVARVGGNTLPLLIRMVKTDFCRKTQYINENDNKECV